MILLGKSDAHRGVTLAQARALLRTALFTLKLCQKIVHLAIVGESVARSRQGFRIVMDCFPIPSVSWRILERFPDPYSDRRG